MRGSPSLPIRTSISRLHRDCQPNRTISLCAPPVNLSGPPVLRSGAARSYRFGTICRILQEDAGRDAGASA